MIEDGWEPTPEDVSWTKETINKMSVGDTWGVADAVLQKVDDDHFDVLKLSTASILPLQRVGKVLNALDVELTTDNAELVEDAQAAAQQSAQTWTCPSSGVPIVNFDLDKPEWVCIEEGEETWRVIVSHTNDEGDVFEVPLSPMDYHLVAGDDLFFTWDNMKVLERHEIIIMADEGTLTKALNEKEVVIMPTMWNESLVPPHLRGLIFSTKVKDEEE